MATHENSVQQRSQLKLGEAMVTFNQELCNTILFVAQQANAPIELAMTSVLSAMGFAAQHHVNVELPYGKAVPSSLFTLAIAPSGSGKSSVTDIAWKVPRELMKSLVPDTQTLIKYKSDYDWWQSRCKLLKKAVSKAETPDDPQVEELTKHLALKPIPPKNPMWLFDDTTPEAILNSMANNWSSVALASAEGGTILQGRAVSHLPQFNQLWSGETVRIDRKTQEPLVINHGCLSMAIMTQPNSFNTFLHNKRELARASGFLARTLTCRMESTTFFPPNGSTYSSFWFDDRMESLLTTAFQQNEITRKVLRFDENAQAMWYNYINQIKQQALNKNNPLHELGDFVAKIPEHIGRIAAVIACFESDNYATVIDNQAMDTAIGLMAFYVQEAIRIYHPQADEIADGKNLLGWLANESRKLQQGYPSKLHANQNPQSFNLINTVYFIDKSTLYHYAPRNLRSKYKLDRALSWLEEHNLVFRTFNGRTEQFEIPQGVVLNHFNHLAVGHQMAG
jgi:hypothetical protein